MTQAHSFCIAVSTSQRDIFLAQFHHHILRRRNIEKLMKQDKEKERWLTLYHVEAS